ncbi:MAG: pentapeptide repeat-containing protein, partial [Nostoc sp. C3-bin3]|nr:pentapeptide repeat-containing protein [Nostoc sp. C3-bin3]
MKAIFLTAAALLSTLSLAAPLSVKAENSASVRRL